MLWSYKVLMNSIYALWSRILTIRHLPKRELWIRAGFLLTSVLILHALWPAAEWVAAFISNKLPHLPDKGLVYPCLLGLTVLATIACIQIHGVMRKIMLKK